MKHLIKYVFISSIFFGPLAVRSQCMLVPVSLEERVSQSSLVIEGRVVGQYSFWKDGNIFTDNRVEVYSLLKGTTDSSFVHILTEGGTVGDVSQVITSVLSLDNDETGVFLCQQTADKNYYTTYASAQGFINYDRKNSTATDAFNKYASVKRVLIPTISTLSGEAYRVFKPLPTVQPNAARTAVVPTITGFYPKSIAAGTKQVLTITGAGFGSTRGNGDVFFYNADTVGKVVPPFSYQYISWTDKEIKLYMPSSLGKGQCAGGGRLFVDLGNGIDVAQSDDSLKVTYAQINFSGSKDIQYQQCSLMGSQETGGYEFIMSADFDTISKGEAKAAFLRAFKKWRCNSQVNWNLSTSVNSNGSTGKANSENLITFTSTTSTLAKGVLGQTISWYTSCSEGKYYVSEIDMVFDRAQKWNYDSTKISFFGKYDFESVLLHEMGHAQQLAHNSDTKALMYWALGSNKKRNTIDNNAIEGAKSVIAGSTAVCGKNPITVLPNGYCADPYAKLKKVDAIVANPNFLMNETTTTVSYSLVKPAPVAMDLYDIYGNHIKRMINKSEDAGLHTYQIDFSGKRMGLYILRTTIGDDLYITRVLNANNF